MGPPPDPLPALPAALFGTRSAGGSTVTGHIPSSWWCHGPPVSPPRCHQHLPGEPGGPVALVAPGDHLDQGHPAKGNLPVPKMILKDWFLPKNCIPAPPHTPSRPPPAFTWGPPSPLHPGGPGSRLLLPGGPWGTEGGQRAPRAPQSPQGPQPTLTTAPRGPGGPFSPRAPREPFCPWVEVRGKDLGCGWRAKEAAAPEAQRSTPHLPPAGPLLSGVPGGPRFALGRREEAEPLPGSAWERRGHKSPLLSSPAPRPPRRSRLLQEVPTKWHGV